MILVDTNVISEPVRPSGNPMIATWLDSQPRNRLYLASTSLAELLSGTGGLPIGKRRSELEAKIELELRTRFEGRILAFDEQAARIYASITERAKIRGIAISISDAQIAAVGEARGMIIATRDIKPFQGIGLRVINPWLQP